MTKGFTDKSGKFRPITDYTKKGTRKSRDQTTKTKGVQLTQKRMKRDEFPLDKVIIDMEKTFETYLHDHDFENPKLRNKNWSVDITYEGGFQEEYFKFWAQPVDESIEPVTFREWISNSDWSEGMDDEDAYQKKIERDPNFAEREYAKWLADTFHGYGDVWFQSLTDAIEDENK